MATSTGGRPRRTREEVREAVRRVTGERFLPVAEFTATPVRLDGRAETASAETLIRWITRGRRGVYLDGFRDVAAGWLTSPEAIARFEAAFGPRCADRAAPPPTPTPASPDVTAVPTPPADPTAAALVLARELAAILPRVSGIPNPDRRQSALAYLITDLVAIGGDEAAPVIDLPKPSA